MFPLAVRVPAEYSTRCDVTYWMTFVLRATKLQNIFAEHYRIFYRLRRRPCATNANSLMWRMKTWKYKTTNKRHYNRDRNSYSNLYCSFSPSHFTAHMLCATNSCAKLSDKPAEITEIRHTTFWNNILPLTSHSSGWRHPLGRRFAPRMRHGILFQNILYPNSPLVPRWFFFLWYFHSRFPGYSLSIIDPAMLRIQ